MIGKRGAALQDGKNPVIEDKIKATEYPASTLSDYNKRELKCMA